MQKMYFHVFIGQAGCIIRARFLDRIKAAYESNPNLASLLVDESFAKELNNRQNVCAFI